MTIQDQIYTIWFPLGIMVLFAVLGALRGVVREALVSGAIVLASLITTLWAGQWGEQVHSLYPGMTQGQEEFTLSFAVLWLVVLVVGYGMGGFVPKGPSSTPSRLGGFLLGLMNGAAVAGWSLRFAYVNLHDAQHSSPFYTNPVSFSLMVWASWYPIVLVLLAALLVLLGPLRRAQTAVSQPSASTDWEPYAAQPAAAAASYQGSRAILSQPPGASSPPPTPSPYSSPNAPTMAFPTQPAPPAAREASTSSPWAAPARQEPPALGLDQRPGERDRGEKGSPGAGRGQDDAGTYGSASGAGRDTPSWLLNRTGASGGAAGGAAGISSGSQATPGEGAMTGGVASDEGATMPVAEVREPAAEAKCPNCGTPAAPGALFCTECGTKLT